MCWVEQEEDAQAPMPLDRSGICEDGGGGVGESEKGRRKLESSMKGMQGRMKQREQRGAQRRPGTCRMTCL